MKKVLIIEDNLDNRENSAEILELANYEVITAENGAIGLGLALSEKPDLIICDIKMPEMDGYDVLQMLTIHEETALIPFVFVSAKAEKCEVLKGMLMGANDYIIKPFDSKILLNAVEMHFPNDEQNIEAQSNLNEDLEDFTQNTFEVNLFQNTEAKECFEIFSSKKKDIIYMDGVYPKGIYFLSDGSYKTYKSNGYHKELMNELYNEDDFFLTPRIVKRCAIY